MLFGSLERRRLGDRWEMEQAGKEPANGRPEPTSNAAAGVGEGEGFP